MFNVFMAVNVNQGVENCQRLFGFFALLFFIFLK